MNDWIAFWDSEHSIYVNARHRDVHYRVIAENIRALIALRLSQARDDGAPVVLDYGCGEALHADRVAEVASRLILCEAAPKVLAGLAERFATYPRIEVHSSAAAAALPDRSLDIVVLHSVAQYLAPTEFDTLLALFRRLLKPTGRLFIGDIIPPRLPAARDAIALLKFAGANGFFIAALFGLGRTLLSDYWRLRGQLGLTRYDESAIAKKLSAAAFAATRLPANIGHNQARMTFSARPV